MSFYLALDPGGTTGWMLFNDGQPVEGGEIPFDNIWEFLNNPQWQEIGLYVVEDYIIRAASAQGGYAHQWNKGEALQVIGAVKCNAQAKAAVVVLQQPSIKDAIHRRLTGNPYNKTTATHMLDASLHGAYYWWKEHPTDAGYVTPPSSEDSVGEGVRRPTRVVEIRGYEGLRGKRRKGGV